jgi:hypothetical protein
VSADTLIGGLIAAALVIVVLYGAGVAFCAQVNATDADTKRPAPGCLGANVKKPPSN